MDIIHTYVRYSRRCLNHWATGFKETASSSNLLWGKGPVHPWPFLGATWFVDAAMEGLPSNHHLCWVPARSGDHWNACNRRWMLDELNKAMGNQQNARWWLMLIVLTMVVNDGYW